MVGTAATWSFSNQLLHAWVPLPKMHESRLAALERSLIYGMQQIMASLLQFSDRELASVKIVIRILEAALWLNATSHHDTLELVAGWDVY